MLVAAEATELPRLVEIRHAAFALHAPASYSPLEVRTLLTDVDEAELYEMIGERRLFVARAAGRVLGLAGWPHTA